jgi:hypothetical protein
MKRYQGLFPEQRMDILYKEIAMKKQMIVGSIMVLMFVACSQGQVLFEGFNGSGIGGWNTHPDSTISQVSLPVYEGTGALKWIYTEIVYPDGFEFIYGSHF